MGKNLCAALNNIKDGKDRRFPNLAIEAVFEYDIDSTPEELDQYCREADFVFNLAGVNRPKEQSEFMAGNFGFASTLLSNLRKYGNTCPVMLSSSIQATLAGRFGTSEYGKSKKAGEELFFDYERDFLRSADNADEADNANLRDQNQSVQSAGLVPRVLIYRFPNLFGKWCRPNYNSAVATFCNAFANDLPYTVNDPSVELELLYIDDLVDEMILLLEGKAHRCEFEGLEVLPAPADDADGADDADNQRNQNQSAQSAGLVPRVLIYRFPNLFGKWCRPNYNSAVATFCNAFANDLPFTVNDPSVELELLYIDDLVDEMICALLGKEHHCEFDGVETVMKEE